MEDPFSERETLLLGLWSKGTDVRRLERLIKEVAETEKSLSLVTPNSYFRMCFYQVAWHWNLNVLSFCRDRYESGGGWASSRQIKLMEGETRQRRL